MQMQSVTVTPEMWYCGDDLVERKEDDGGLADGDLLKKAGFTAAHKRLSSPSLANVNRCRCRYLELTDDVSRVFFGATSCGTSYYSCWVPIGKSVPDEGMIPRSVVEATIEAGGSHFFDRLMVVSYLRTIGVEGEKQKEWAVVGRASDNGKEHRFLIAYWAERGMTPPSLGVIRALAQEEQDRKNLKDERDHLKDSLESALDANMRRRHYRVYRLVVFGLVALTGFLPLVAPLWLFWISAIVIAVVGLFSFMTWLDDDIFSGGIFGEWRGAIFDDGRLEPEDVINGGVSRKTIRGYRRRLKEIGQQIDPHL